MNKERGGVALEYVIISAFGLITTLAAVGYFGEIIKKEMKPIVDKTEVPFEDPWGEK